MRVSNTFTNSVANNEDHQFLLAPSETGGNDVADI